MELTEMEKRMLYQTEGTERYAVLREMSMVSRYAGDPARRKAAESLMKEQQNIKANGNFCLYLVEFLPS